MAGALSLQGLVKHFGEETAVDGLDLEIGEGEFFSLLGPSGCGKTTTLRMIAGFERPDAGTIRLDGQDLVDVPPHKRPVNTVFQSYALFPLLTVARQRRVRTALPARHQGRRTTTRRAPPSSWCRWARCRSASRTSSPAASSSGWRWPALWCSSRRCCSSTSRWAPSTPSCASRCSWSCARCSSVVGTTFVYVTHDQDEALTMSDRLAVLEKGKVMQIGTPSEVYSTPANTHVATFLGTANLWDAEVVAAGEGTVTCTVGGVELEVETTPRSRATRCR